jgi:hypothetical protein
MLMAECYDVVAIREIGVAIGHQQVSRGLRHDQILEALAAIKIVHMIVVDVCLSANGRIMHEAIADDFRGECHGAI